MDNKTDFRIYAKTIRKELDMESISEKLCQKIRLCTEYKKAMNVMIFYPLKHEVNLLNLLNDKKNFYLPRINGNKLDVCSYELGDKLSISAFKTREPLTSKVSSDLLDLILLPALAVDKYNYRLGYGKGYFDRFLAKNSATTIVPIPKELVFEKLPFETHDKKVDIVITQ